MCGIAGIIAPEMRQPELRTVLQPMLDAIRHRGPDDSGTHVEDGVALGMRRLSIIDVEGGRQPMLSADGRTALVYNGEIYNAGELREYLIEKGHVFRTRCDTEVVLHGYRHWQEGVLDHLNGMFAFAILDREAGSLFLARDHFGIKPLYTFAGRDIFAFCSEPAPLLGVPGVSRRLDAEAMRCFLSYKYVPAPSTFVQGIQKLGPGTSLRADRNGRVIQHRVYWRLEAEAPEGNGSAGLEERLVSAVRAQLVSDVPLGVFLSGGIDSGLLLWAARRGKVDGPPDAHTVGFDEASFDETPLAARTAAHLGAEHHIARQSLPGPDELDAMVASFGEPFANVSIPANFAISRAAARHVKVALNGSGADELFGGYDRYFAVRPPSSLRAARALSPVLLPLAEAVGVGHSKGALVPKARRFLETANLQPAEAHASAIRLFTETELQELVPEVQAGPDPILSRFDDAPDRDAVDRAMWVDISTMLADDYLTLIDRTSMAASLEVRVPFLDLDLARYAFSLPASEKIKGWRKKRALRRLAAEHLPREIARNPKQGMESPIGAWFRGELGDAMIQSLQSSHLREVLDPTFVERLVREHAAGRRDASKQLLGICTLCSWVEHNSITV